MANKDLGGQEINLSKDEKSFLENWIIANPTSTSDITKVHAWLEKSLFKKEELLPHELDDLLRKILSGDDPGVKRKHD